MTEWLPVRCPYCGERAELDVDDSGWTKQSYVQDCPVCCQPWQVEVVRDEFGDFRATVRTGEE